MAMDDPARFETFLLDLAEHVQPIHHPVFCDACDLRLTQPE